jgi:lysozyme
MKISQRGIDLIKEFEGLELHAYNCSAGVPTIGYGHTGGVEIGDTITPEEAQDYLLYDLELFERAVNSSVTVALTQNMFDALVCWTYNLGAGSLRSSTLLKVLNEGKYDEVPAQIKRWDKCNGQPLKGLTRRREAEAKLFEEQ